MGGYDNKTSVDLSKKRKLGGLMNALKSGDLYKEYINHPTAQYEVTFLEYKKKRKQRKY